jgi:hypothetical protein
MSEDVQFNKLAKKAYLSYHQDGMIDILIGWIILSIGLGVATGWYGPWAVLGFFIAGALYAPLKRRITIPRMGYVEFTPNWRREALIKIVYPLVVVTFMVVLLLVAGVPEGVTPVAPVWTPSETWPNLKLWLEGKSSFLFGVITFAILGVIGLGTEIRRLYAYALMSLVIMTGGQVLSLKTHISVIALGCIFIIVGVAMLVHFLRKHPIISAEETTSGEHINHAVS